MHPLHLDIILVSKSFSVIYTIYEEALKRPETTTPRPRTTMSILTKIIDKITGYNKNINKSLSIYNAQLYLCEIITVDKFKNIYSPDYALDVVRSIYPTIMAYNAFLKSFITKTPVNEYIPVYEIPTKLEIIPIGAWYMHEGTYIDPVDATKSFLRNVKEFIELYEHYSSLKDIEFNAKKNITNAKPILSNLFNLLEDLKNV